jgi:2-dehydro-3-deoxy-D-gluconate 5-dehydrogenase
VDPLSSQESGPGLIMTLFDLSGNVALVTGASGGLGAAMAIALAEAGADVVVHGHSRSTAATCEAVAAVGRRAAPVLADLRKRDATDRLIADAVAAFGHLDILINNAGTIRRAPAATHPDEDWDAVIEVNLTSVFRLARAAGQHFLAQGRGKIVNIASLLSFQGGITVPGYAAAKGGVAQLTKALANEWAGKGVNVNAIAPGYMVTDNTAALRGDPVRSRQILERIPAGRWGDPKDLAGAVVFLSSSASDYVHGQVLAVDGGWLGR